MSPQIDPIGLAKHVFRPILGDRILGLIDYARFPNRAADIGGAFNGQPARQTLFRELVAELKPVAIIETGTYLGTTTEFIAQTGLPVFTMELDARRWGYARARLWRRRNVMVLHEDSRTGLRKLFAGPLRDRTGSTLLLYLDAHWNDDLPLVEEIEIIFGQCPSAIVMLDDFQVPSDAGYGYDDYGCGKSLVFDYIAQLVSAHRLRAFYPSTPSAEEGGWHRGCVILTKQDSFVTILASMPLLRPAADEPMIPALSRLEPSLNALPDAH